MSLAPRPQDGGHPGELTLRRLRAGELNGPDREPLTQHTQRCARCRARLAVIDEEQSAFARDIPFDRFAGGVERAARVPRPRRLGRRLMLPAMAALAAAAALVFALPASPPGDGGGNRIKGDGVAVVLRVASADGQQRSLPSGMDGRAEASARLSPGDRLRIGIQTSGRRHVIAIAIDDRGEVTPLYPEAGAAVAIDPASDPVYLPDSFELTGVGRERIVVLVADRPLALADALLAARNGWSRARGDLGAMAIELPSQPGNAEVAVSSWLLHKPGGAERLGEPPIPTPSQPLRP